MSEVSTSAAVTMPQNQQHLNQAQPPASNGPVSASGASTTNTSTSNGSSRRAVASSAASLSSDATPATTTLSAMAAGGQAQPPMPLPPMPPPQLLETLPSAETQRHIAEARAAIVASIGNMLDTELQGRAEMLHANASALDKQERGVRAATDGLRREREKLAREADTAARKLKEVGNVQNWAEVLERGFLVLEETVRLATRDDDDGADGYSRSWSGSGSRSGGSECSCSDCGRTLDGRLGDVAGEDDDIEEGRGGGGGGGRDGQGKMDVDGEVLDKGKGREEDAVMMDGVEAMSDASQSLFDGESSSASGTAIAKNSETASLSPSC